MYHHLNITLLELIIFYGCINFISLLCSCVLIYAVILINLWMFTILGIIVTYDLSFESFIEIIFAANFLLSDIR